MEYSVYSGTGKLLCGTGKCVEYINLKKSYIIVEEGHPLFKNRRQEAKRLRNKRKKVNRKMRKVKKRLFKILTGALSHPADCSICKERVYAPCIIWMLHGIEIYDVNNHYNCIFCDDCIKFGGLDQNCFKCYELTFDNGLKKNARIII